MTQVACPDLVPLIQRGDTHGQELHEAAKAYAEPLKRAGADTVILGCTHYPLIRQMLQRIFGREVTLITSAEEIAREAAETLARRGVGNDPGPRGRLPLPVHRRSRGVSGGRGPVPAASDRGVERVDPASLEVAA